MPENFRLHALHLSLDLEVIEHEVLNVHEQHRCLLLAVPAPSRALRKVSHFTRIEGSHLERGLARLAHLVFMEALALKCSFVNRFYYDFYSENLSLLLFIDYLTGAIVLLPGITDIM